MCMHACIKWVLCMYVVCMQVEEEGGRTGRERRAIGRERGEQEKGERIKDTELSRRKKKKEKGDEKI